MNDTAFDRLFNDVRFSLATIVAVWTSLALPILFLSVGVVIIGGGVREVGAVFFAAALFSAADIFGLLMRVSRAAEDDESVLDDLLGRPVPVIAKTLNQRYL